MTANGLVVYLVWASLGEGPVERFLASYRRHEAGTAHRLLVVYKEFRRPAALDEARRRFAGVEHDELQLPEPCLDLAAYARIAATADAPWLQFLNSNSELLDAGWLAKPLAHLLRPTVGLVGATGSHEATPASMVDRLRRRPRARFPNPHVRTNAFMLESELARVLDWGEPHSKELAWQVENGPRSLTRQVLNRGLQALVVGRNGRAYPPGRWREADVFRTPLQSNLLVADNRTRDYAEADDARRAELERLAWGSLRSVSV
jgi:hypothetical protein